MQQQSKIKQQKALNMIMDYQWVLSSGTVAWFYKLKQVKSHANKKLSSVHLTTIRFINSWIMQISITKNKK